MSKITVTTIAGATSGSDANKVKIESGDTLESSTIGTASGAMSIKPAGTEVVNVGTTGDVLVKGNGNNRAALILRAGSNTANSQIRLGDQAADDVGRIMYDHSDDTLRFQTAGAERFRVSASGIHIGGTGAANALDDYEEGTWTPELSTGNSSSYDGRSGHYTKIGRQVIATFKLEIGNTFAGGTTQYLVGGLPFAAVSGLTHSTGSGFLHYYENLRQNVTGVTMRIDNGQSVMYFSAKSSVSNALDVNANILQAQSNIYGTLTYITA